MEEAQAEALRQRLIQEGQRQHETDLGRVKANHVQRYQWAIDQGCQNRPLVWDAGCGMGYGTHMLAKANGKVIGLEAYADAVTLARHYWSADNIEFVEHDLHNPTVPGYFATGVVCFECLEHLIYPEMALMRLWKASASGAVGWFSVPSSDVEPHRLEGNPFHLRHYTMPEFEDLLVSCGWSVRGVYAQTGSPHNPDPIKPVSLSGGKGRILLAECRRIDEQEFFGGIHPNAMPDEFVRRAHTAFIERCVTIRDLRRK